MTISSSSIPSSSALGEILEEQTADTSDTSDGSHTPALPTLRAQQSDIREYLRDGFSSRRELLFWSHAATAVSVGRVPDDWFATLINDQWTVAACLSDIEDRQHLCGDRAPDDEQAKAVRLEIIQNVLSPAFQSALGVIRQQAADFTEDRDGVKHTSRQRYLAMRPRLHQTAVAQHRALRRAFGAGSNDPLESRAAVIEWADYAGYSSAGHLRTDFTSTVASPLGEWWYALTQDRGATLESLLAAELLPAMNKALRTATREAEEMPNETARGNTGGGVS